ncbi:MAG: hypothetical protein NZL89_01435 [Leptospiraceae bacterium]|nr:hypothetical protein [Leptospiraceae bacterium]
MVELKSEPIIVVKGRFRAPIQRYYGLFFYLINNRGGYIDISSVVISTNSEVFNALSLTDSWKKYEAAINKLKYEGKYAQAITNEFQAKLKQLALDKQYFADLTKAIFAGDQQKLNAILASFYQRIIKDDEFQLESYAERASLQDTLGQNEEQAAAVQDSPEGTYLPIKLDLDPIAGKNVKDIRPGDKILVRVIPENERANAFIDNARLRTESGFIRSAPFTVTSVIYPEKGVELIGKLQEGVYGRILEEQNVLVRMAEPVKPPTKAPQVSSQATLPDDKKQLLFIGAGLAGIAILAILLYFLITSF